MKEEYDSSAKNSSLNMSVNFKYLYTTIQCMQWEFPKLYTIWKSKYDNIPLYTALETDTENRAVNKTKINKMGCRSFNGYYLFFLLCIEFGGIIIF